MSDWLVADLSRFLQAALEHGAMTCPDVTAVVPVLATAMRRGDSVERCLVSNGVQIHHPDLVPQLMELGRRTILEEYNRDQIAKLTVHIDEMGGYEKLVVDTAAYRMIASAKQRALTRYLDRLGPPGRIRMDPRARELELRGHVFEAELIGSYGKVDWLWAWGNLHLGLEESMMAIAKEVKANTLHLRPCQEACVAFRPDAHRLFVQNMFGAIAVACGAADVYFIGNESQTYGLCKGQIPDDQEQLADVCFALNESLFEPTGATRAMVQLVVKRFGFDVVVETPVQTVLSHHGQRLSIDFESDRLVSMEMLM